MKTIFFDELRRSSFETLYSVKLHQSNLSVVVVLFVVMVLVVVAVVLFVVLVVVVVVVFAVVVLIVGLLVLNVLFMKISVDLQ